MATQSYRARNDFQHEITRRDFVKCAVANLVLLAMGDNGLRSQVLPVDRFGIRMLYPTRIGGRVWESKWDNGHWRRLDSGEWDPYDPEFIVRGDVDPDRQVVIDGKGTAILSGDYPRVYVYDEPQMRKWRNLEVTFYGKRIRETGSPTSQGFVVGVRSEHQNASEKDDEHLCAGQTYYARMLYDGRVNFQREVVYHKYFSTNKPSEDSRADWPDRILPRDTWIGLKAIVVNINDNSNVTLTLYRDLTGGVNGGDWRKLIEYTDIGDWPGAGDNPWTDSDVQAHCGWPPTRVFAAPATSVFIRNDKIYEARYKWYSIREIVPDPAQYNFENGEQGWISTGGIIAALSSADAHAFAGDRSLAISFDGPYTYQSQVYVEAPPVPPGKTITFHIWIPSGNRLTAIAPFVEDGRGVWKDDWRRVSDLVPDAWNTFTVAVPVHAATPLARLGVEFSSGAAWSGVCYVDTVGW